MAKITLKAARINRGLTQVDAAKALGVSNRTLYNWERGFTCPNVKYVIPLCELYDVDYDDISFYPTIRLKRI